MFALITQLTVQTVLLQVAALYTPPHVLLDSWWSPGHFAQILPYDTGVLTHKNKCPNDEITHVSEYSL